MPLTLHVECHSFFLPQSPEAPTQLGAALHCYGVSLHYARSPQAKGKIERQHPYWQRRLPSLFAAEGISTPEQANPLPQPVAPPSQCTRSPPRTRTHPKAAAALAQRERRVSPPTVLGGPKSGASALPSSSAPTDACPSAFSAAASLASQALVAFSAATPMVTSPSSLQSPTQHPPFSASKSAPADTSCSLSAFARTKLSTFECFTTVV